MAKQKELEFDTSWIDELGLSENQKQALLEKTQGWMEKAESHAGNLHAGMTKAMQERAVYEKDAKEAEAWRAWKNDGNTPYLTRWAEVREVLDQNGGLDGLREKVMGPKGTATREAAQATQAVATAFQGGDITWEQAQGLLQQIQHKMAALDEVAQWYQSGRQEDYKRFEKGIQDVAQAATQQLAAVFNPIVEAIEFSRRYPYDKFPDREVPMLMKTMGEKGYRQLSEAVNSLYGETDTRSSIQAELKAENEKTLVAEREKMRREMEKERGGGEGAAEAVGVRTFQSRHDAQGKRLARSPQEFMESVLQKVSQNAG